MRTKKEAYSAIGRFRLRHINLANWSITMKLICILHNYDTGILHNSFDDSSITSSGLKLTKIPAPASPSPNSNCGSTMGSCNRRLTKSDQDAQIMRWLSPRESNNRYHGICTDRYASFGSCFFETSEWRRRRPVGVELISLSCLLRESGSEQDISEVSGGVL